MGKRFVKLIKYFYDCFIETIYPHINTCICCGEEGKEVICKDCDSKISYINQKIKLNDFDEYVYPCCYYGHEIKKLLFKFKYDKDFYVGEKLGDLLIQKINLYRMEDTVLTYIPSSKKNIKIRGFDQCEFLAKYIEKKIGIKVYKYLIKSDKVSEQKKLSHKERLYNLQGAFKCSRDVSGKSVILIDDVVTTGSTLNFAKKALEKEGAKKVLLIVLAKSTI